MSTHPTDPRGQTTVLVVNDLRASIEHYTRVLGFDEDFVYGDPPSYAGVCRGPVALHLQAARVAPRPAGGGGVYLYVEDAFAAFDVLSARGASIDAAPEPRDYGLADFIVRDLDGNQLIYASELRART